MAVLAAAALILCHEKAPAQDADPMGELEAPLDPSAPLAPLPDLGVEWPDMEAEAGEDIAYQAVSGAGPFNEDNDPSSAFVGIYRYGADNTYEWVKAEFGEL